MLYLMHAAARPFLLLLAGPLHLVLLVRSGAAGTALATALATALSSSLGMSEAQNKIYLHTSK